MTRAFLLTFACCFCFFPTTAQVALNEIAPTNDSLFTDQFGGFPDWIELYNNSAATVSLDGYHLSDDSTLIQKWDFPSGMSIAPFDHLLVFASDMDTLTGTWAHTNFKISASGEAILLADASGTVIDQVISPQMLSNDSYGRDTDGTGAWGIFDDPTPESSNDNASFYTGYCDDEVIFSIQAGFYTGTQTLSLSGPAEIRYTLDGTMPTATSNLYSGPITLDTTVVIRAACFSAGALFERAYTNTYLLNEPIHYPVFSLSTDPDNFFDWNTGIYVKGPNADPGFPFFGANFHQNWEKPIHVEFFDTTGLRHIAQDAGVKIHGNYSRGHDQKSLRLISRSKYGATRFEYPFFEDKNIREFKQILLRNAGDDFQVANMRDGLNRLIARDLELFDGMAYTPSVVFLNGVYWGIHGIRERIHEHYLEENHGVDPDSVVIINFDGTVAAGDSFDLQAFSQAIKSVDMSVQSNFDQWTDSVEIYSMADYFIHNIHMVNWDWPFKNVRLWRAIDRTRPIRYLSFDLDGTFELYGIGPPTDNLLSGIVDDTGLHENLISSMLDNAAYRDYFINRYADLMNTSFHPANISGIVDSLETLLSLEMPRHLQHWGNLGMGGWQYNVNQLKDFAVDRLPIARTHLQNEYNLNGQVDITLAMSPPGAGIIKMNTVFPDTFPWTGVYYDGVPVTMTAYPKPGYTFDHWLAPNLISSPDTNKSITLNVNIDETFTAHFTGSPAALELTVSEVNYNPIAAQNAGDWIEFHNFGSAAVDISGWTLKDERDYNVFTFPEGTILGSGAYLVVCEDLVAFDSVYSNVSNRIGSLGFSLSNSGDEIRLYNLQGNTYLAFAYDDEGGWPTEADGQGNTLELLDPLGDLNSSANWFAGCTLGSPGGPFTSPCDSTQAVVQLTVSEINYHSSGMLDMGDWFELYNYGADTIDLTGWTMEDNDPTHVFNFPQGTTLNPGERLVIADDPGLLAVVHPSLTGVLGPLGFGLSNSSDQINLKDDQGSLYLSLTYMDNAPWPVSPDGDGYTLELVDPQGNLSSAANWFAGCLGGSPGAPYTSPCPPLVPVPDLTVSEINYHSADTADSRDWIELHNYGNIDADLGGWTFGNSNSANAYVFPAGTSLMPGERLVLAENLTAFTTIHPAVTNVIGDFGFDLGDDGDEIRLLDASGGTYLSFSYDDQVPWPPEADGNGYTLEQLSPTGTLGNPNNWFAGCPKGSPGTPFVGPCDTTVVVPLPDLTIGEINYNSSPLLDAGDWLELWNFGTIDADLSAWVFKDDNDANSFTIPPGTVLQPGERLVISNDLTAFATSHPLVFNVIGPFAFGLGNGGDSIRLYAANGDPYLAMAYSDDPPWPADPDGDGYTLELVNPNDDLNLAANWSVGCFGGSPGTAFVSPCPPPVGLDPLSLREWRIFPNPGSGRFQIEVDGLEVGELQLRVLDALGQEIWWETVRTAGGALYHQLDLSGKSKGVYLLQVRSAQQLVHFRLVIE